MKNLLNQILLKRKEMPAERSLLVGISGIDASGKGFITAKLAERLRKKGLKVADINVDGWLNLPQIRFDKRRPAENFYENALRLDELFKTLIRPLKNLRTTNLTTDFAEETAVEYRKHLYLFRNIDIILLEGIFLFKKTFVSEFDLRIWIDCSFETALGRAVARAQEGFSEEKTISAYKTIYFPAQEIHFERDVPKRAADLIFDNDKKKRRNQR